MTKKVKIIAIVTGVIVLIVIIYFIVRALTKKDNTYKENPIAVDMSKVTIDDTTANIIVRNLLQAMDRQGTDETAIIENLTGLNKEELLLVMKKFGSKPYFDTGLDTRGAVAKALTIDILHDMGERDLIGWIKSEMSGNNLNLVKELFTNVGIPF